MKHSTTNKSKISNQCEALLYALVLALVFEGILRKFFPPLRTPIFFLKDVLCIIAIVIVSNEQFAGFTQKVNSIWIRLFILFLPLFIFTALKDPFLAVFGLKQYLLYIVTGIVVTMAFPVFKEQNFRKFIFFTALLLIPTTIVAILQNALPPSHWLNLSVGGESLEAFSAAGFLRVGSTFSFTAQYSWFLNAEAFFLATSFFMPPRFKNNFATRYKTPVYLILVLMLIIGAFITGGRTAVIGSGGTLALGFVFIGIKRPAWLFSKGLAIISILLIGLTVLKAKKPQFFLAYEARSSGTDDMTHNEEITKRIVGGLTDLTNWFWKQDAASVFFGNGMGIMSNGSALVSEYAARIRNKDAGFWTEGDMPTTFWEGGLYLGVIWYGFRISLIILSYRLWNALRITAYTYAASVPLAYVVIHGLTAPLGMQPPLTLWWWFAIGSIFIIYRLEKHKVRAYLIKMNDQKQKKKNYAT